MNGGSTRSQGLLCASALIADWSKTTVDMMNRSHQSKPLKKRRRTRGKGRLIIYQDDMTPTHNSTHKKEQKYARKRQEQEDGWWLQEERPSQEWATERQKTPGE
tara:strand:+ start:88 stop:399 length:312 start_codon:yes stop_codon:yes gene_type:complete